MKDFLKTNCYDVQETMIIVGSCIQFKNYVAVDNKLIEIPLEIISLSKNLSKLKEEVRRSTY